MTDRTPSGPSPDPGHLLAYDELAVAWALHTLEPEDEVAFVLHLADCAHCARTVAETEETLGIVGAAVTPADPPAHLRARVMDAVAEDGTAVDARPAPAVVTSLAPRHRRPPARRRASRLVLAAAAALVVVAVGGLAVANQQLRAERDAEAGAAARNAPVVEVLRDAGTPGVAHASLAGPDGALVGLVVAGPTGPRVLTTGLDANPSDAIYVLWGLDDAQPTPLGTFDVSGRGPVVTPVSSEAEAAPWSGFAVSLEPGRTAPASPTRVVASGQVGR